MYYRDLSDRHHFYLLGQDKPHSISAGIKPLSSAADAKFKEMAPNLLLDSKKLPQKVKMQGLPFEARSVEKGWLVDGDRSVQTFSQRFFQTIDCQAATRSLTEKWRGIKKLAAECWIYAKLPRRIYIGQDFVGFQLIARNLAPILRTLRSQKIQETAQFGGFFQAFH